MTRQQRRKELRDIEKEVKSIWKTSPLAKIMRSKPFNDLAKEDIDILDKGEYTDKNMQDQYNTAKRLLLRLRDLQQRSVFLRGDNVKAVPNIEN